MKQEIKIEKGVPFVRKKSGSKYQHLIDNMNIGDSVLVPSWSKSRSLRVVMVANFGAKSVSMQQQPDGQVRVWRVK